MLPQIFSALGISTEAGVEPWTWDEFLEGTAVSSRILSRMIIFVEGSSLVQLSKHFLLPREGDAALSGGGWRNGRDRVAGGGGSVD